MVPQRLYQALGLTLLLIAGPTSAAENRNPKWAKPLEIKGAENAFQVSPALYRSAQPTALGFEELKKIGIRTVVNLRSFHSDRKEIGDTGLAYEHMYMKAWHAEDEEVARF
ncbi:uncharacterized protein METZ01_LOCUS495165, partial [marine metagenome]